MRFTVDGKNTKKYILEANGTGVAFMDLDNDGNLDLRPLNEQFRVSP